MNLLAAHAWFASHLKLIFILVLCGYVVLIGLKIIMSRRSTKQALTSDSHGSATFGTLTDAKGRGRASEPDLTEGPGIVLGKLGDTYLRIGHLLHAIFVGPTGSGKTTTAISTILSWRGVAVIIDPKGSIRRHTESRRRGPDGQNPVYVFAPTDPASPDQIDPFSLIRWKTIYEPRDAARMAQWLTTKDEIDVRTDASTYYRSGAQSVLLFGILVVGNTSGARCSPARVRHWLLHAPHTPKAFVTWLRTFTTHVHPTIAEGAEFLLAQPLRELPKWWAAALNWLDPWLDPILAYNTNATTIPLASLQTEERPSTVYFQVAPEDLKGPPGRLLKLILTQWRTLLHESDLTRFHQACRHRQLVLFDDMGAFERFPLIQHIAAHDAEYGWQLLMLVQSFEQLWEVLGAHASLLANCNAWVIFCPNYPDTAELISRRLGKTTVVESTARVSQSGWFGRTQISSGTTAHARDLKTLAEVHLIAPDEVLIFINGRKPFWVHQARWYEHPFWAAGVPDEVRRAHRA